MECGLCGTLNRDLARFCGGCGAPLGRICPTCKSEIDAGLRFCDQCGTEVDATPVDAAPAAPGPASEAVRKTVTVLFADLGGSTGFGERTDPEIARQVLARYHAMLQQAIDAHGGTVAKFMGDGMMATFGIPEIAEDDAERAVRAGIEIQDRFARFASDIESRYGETLTARVGINTGEIVIGAADADLVGDALNVAARLEKACRPGHVLVGDETWRLTRGVLAYESLGEVTVSGRAAPVGTYEVSPVERRAVEAVAPFVGREAELARLRVAFDRAVADRAAVLVTVLGSPGLGKTRLSREFLAGLAATGAAATFEIRCDRAGTATFAPVADLVRLAAGLGDVDTEPGVRERLTAMLDGVDDVERVVAGLVGVLGVAPLRSVEETFWSVRRGVEVLAAARPLVVVIDDIQWAEPKLLDLAEHLQEWASDAPVLLVGLARPELRELRPTFVEPGRRVADVLALDGLDARATEELAARLLGSRLPRDLVARLPVSTDGNPLFVRELVRMLVDDRVVVRRDDGEWDLAIDAEAIEVPPTIQSLLATRVERLPADELRVLECASVVGAEFSVGALRELVGDGPDIPLLLERMRRRELVEPTGSYWGDEPVHRFHHVLIRDAAYRRLLKGARAELHRRVGEWTDTSAGGAAGEHEITVAFHYEQAYRYRTELGTADDETDRLGARAAELLEVAARRALEGDDLAAAGALASRALAVLPESDRDARPGLLVMACESLLASGDVVAGAPLVEELSGRAGADPRLAAWADCFRAQLVGLTAPEGLVEAEALAAQAAITLDALGDGAGEAKAHQVRALLLARLGRVGEAEAVLDLALGAAREADDRRRVTAVLGAAPQAALFGPSPVARAGGRCLDVVRLLRITTASPSVEATSMRCQAVLEALRGRFDVARSMLASSRAALKELGLRHGLLETDLFTGMVELIAGDTAAAVAPLRAAYEGLGTLGVGADAGQAAALLASALLEQGEVDEAELMAAESEALAGQNLKTAIAWRTAKADVLAARGDLDTAVMLACEAVGIAAGTDLVLDHADACVVLADLRDAAGDAAGASAARADALRLYEAKGATVPAERVSEVAPRQEPVSVPTAADPAAPLAANSASRLIARVQQLLREGHADRLGPFIADEYEHEDRRRIARMPVQDRAATGAYLRLMQEQGYELPEPEILATRGDQLCLFRGVATTSSGDESPVLGVVALNEHARLRRVVLFDEDATDAAIGELDRAYFVGEGAPFQRVLSAVGRYSAAVDDHDVDAAREVLAPDFLLVDHQPLGFGTGDRDYYIEWSRLDRSGRGLTRTLYVNDHALLSVNVQTVVSDEGSRYERGGCVVMGVDNSDRINRVELFADDDFAAALHRLDELGAGSTADPRTPLIENAASRFMEPLRVAFNGKDREALGRLIAPDYVHEDRRSIVASVGLDPRGRLEELAATIDQGFVFAEPVAIAVRGDRLALSRMVTLTPAGDESARLSVNEIGADGRMTRSVLFDDDDLAAAVDELDEWFLAGEGAPHAAIVARVREFVAALDARNNEAIAAMSAAGATMTDHRRFGMEDGRAFTRGLIEYVDVRQATYVTRYLLAPDVSLASVVMRGVDANGGEVVWFLNVVAAYDGDARFTTSDLYDAEDWDTALARFDELSAQVPAEPKPENAATAAMARVIDLCHERRFDEMRTMLTDDFVREDRRHGVAAPTADGPDEFIRAYAAWFDVGFDTLTMEPLAARGDDLVLAHLEWRSPDGRKVGFLAVYELAADGRFVRGVHFDEDDRSGATATLDASFAGLDTGFAGAAVPHPTGPEVENAATRAERTAMAGVDAYLRSGGAVALDLPRSNPDYMLSDRRPIVGMGPVDASGSLTVVATMLGQGYVGVQEEIVAVRGERFGLTLRTWVTASGDETRSLVVTTVDEVGRLQHQTMFDDGDLDAALEELDARYFAGEGAEHAGTGATGAVPENATTRLIARTLELMNRSDWDGLTAMNVAAPNVVRFDRRHTVSAPTVNDRESFAVNAIGIYDVFGVVRPEPVAVRGERLALIRLHCGEAPAFTMQLLVVYELDLDGRIVREADFDDDDLDSALGELDERYLAGEGAAHLDVLVPCVRFRAATLAGDVDALRDVTAANFAFADHRRLGFGSGDRDYYLAASRTRTEVATDGPVVNRLVEVEGRALLTLQAEQTNTPEGSEYERGAYVVMAVDGSGRIRAAEWFDEDRYADAVARLHDLGRFAPAGAVLANAASHALAAILAAPDVGDLDRLGGLIAETLRHEDRRPLVGEGRLDGRAAMVVNLTAIAELQARVTIEEIVAMRGDRLVLARVLHSTQDGFEIAVLEVVGVDERGRVVEHIVFEPDDLGAALDELDERYLAGEGSEFAHVIRRTGDLGRAAAAADWDAVEAAVGDDFDTGAVRTPEPENVATRVLLEAAPLLWTDLDAVLGFFTPDVVGYARETGPTAGASAEDPARWLDVLASLAVTYDDLRLEPIAVRGDRLALFRQEFVAHGFVTPALLVVELDEQHRISRLETFAEDDLAGAAELLTDRDLALRGPTLTAPERYLVAAFDAWRRQDFVAFADTMEPGFVRTDRGAIGMGVEDRDTYVANMREFAALVPDAVPCPARVHASDRAVVTVQHTRGTSGDGSDLAWDVVYVIRVGASGRAVEMVTFDEGQWDEALDLFDAWSAEPVAGEPGPDEIEPAAEDLVGRSVLAAYRALNRREWDRLEAYLADDLALVDHRTLGFPPATGGIALVSELHRLVEQVPDVVAEVTRLESDGLVALVTTHQAGTTAAGTAAAWDFLTVVAVDPDTGLIVRHEYFDPDDDVRAQARFEDLGSGWADVDEGAHEDRPAGDEAGLAAEALWSVLDGHEVEVLDRIVTPTVTFTDHLPNGLPSVRSAAALVKVFARLFALAPDTRFVTGPPTVAGSAARLDVEQRSTAPSGTGYRWDRVVVIGCADDDRIAAIECFAAHERADAAARLAEWSGGAAPTAEVAGLADGVSEAFARRDWEWIRAQIADDIELRDHRSTVSSHVASGADAVIELLRGFADVGFVSMRNEVVEARGDRLVLFRRTYRTDAGFELMMLAGAERDAAGKIVGMVLFDADDLDAARAELDRRGGSDGM